jgi:type II restriction/modification system DNA methylase subunit YeeA
MDTTGLKKFAQAARNLLIDQITSKLDVVVDPASPARRQYPKAMKGLDAGIARDGKSQIIEQVAYTWFNRFTALRFMDANGYTAVGIVSPAEGQTRPEVLAEAMAGILPEGASAGIIALLDGRTPSSDPQAEAYRLLLVHACNQWHGPMPFLFEQIDDYTELLMPEDLLSQASILAQLREVMTEDACQDVEIIGWLYQFYISEKKDQVFAGLKKNQKITAENIPAATQLFTPHWIVRYLVENSLGRLWLLNRPDSRLAERMDYYIAPEEPETDFLRIGKPEEIRICDPACGSGHMLTYAFDLLYAIYEEGGYEATEIPALILRHNLTGVEIDDRAGALAAFALAMKAAARLGRRQFLRMEAKPDICVLQNVGFTETEMQDVAAVVGKDLFTDELCETLGQFEQAKNFGSLIVPKLRDPAETLRVVEARDFGGDLLLKEVQARVVAVLRMAEALSPKNHVVVANPPYMGGKGMNKTLEIWAKKHFKNSRADLYAMFMERSLELCAHHGFMAMINMQSWMFLSTFDNLRRKLLTQNAIVSMAHLGERGFNTIGGAIVSTTAFVIGKTYSPETEGIFLRLVSGRNEAEKSSLVRDAITGITANTKFRSSAADFRRLPGNPIAYWASNALLRLFDQGRPITEYVSSRDGLTTGDNEAFIRFFWEPSIDQVGFGYPTANDFWISGRKFAPLIKGGSFRKWFGNLSSVITYDKHHYGVLSESGNKLPSREKYFLRNLNWTRISSPSGSFRYTPEGCIFESASLCTYSDVDQDFFYALAGANSCITIPQLDLVNPTTNLLSGYFDMIHLPDHDTAVRSISAQNAKHLVDIAKSDWDAYETSWDFTKLPLLQPDYRAETLEASYTALRTYWQGMTDEMRTLEEENNRIFIDSYGLQDELTPEVPLNEITLTCNPAYRYGIKKDAEANETRLRADTMAAFLSYAVGCMFGRYSLDAPGLILANRGETLADYLARVPAPTFMPDEDNVIPVLDGDWFHDDITERFRLFLRTTFGEQHFRENLRYIEEALGKDIRKYFTKDFYADHVKRYKKRPIYWMFSSPKGTFNALIYMHRYRGDTVSVILNDYLRELISKLQSERGRLEKLSDDPSASQGQRTKALKDVAVVVKQIDELNDWERDVVFPLAQTKIEIDLDDGVKANYPKFGAALKKIAGLEAKDD